MKNSLLNPAMAGFLFLMTSLSSCKEPTRSGKVPHPVPDPAKAAVNTEKIRSIRAELRSGDLIFRNGNDEVSRAARSFNRKDTSYSHCGIILIENDSVFVYHALGGIYNPSQKLMRQRLEEFCDPRDNNAVGIYRYPLDDSQSVKLQSNVNKYYRAGIPFDLYFNYQSDDRFYCAEFVFKSLNGALGSRLSSYVRTDTIPYGVTTDDLFLLPGCRLVRKENFIY